MSSFCEKLRHAEVEGSIAATHLAVDCFRARQWVPQMDCQHGCRKLGDFMHFFGANGSLLAPVSQSQTDAHESLVGKD